MRWAGPAKSALGSLALSSPLTLLTGRALSRRIGIAYAHYVGEPTSYYADFHTGLTADRLDKDLKTLARRFTFAPLSEVLRQEKPASGKPLLAVTFDDGFDLIRTGAADVLEAHGARATTFLITDCIDNRRLMWRSVLSVVFSASDRSRLADRYNRLMRAWNLPEIREATELLSASLRWPMDGKDELAGLLWEACELPPVEQFLKQERPYFSWEGIEEWLARGHSIGLHTRTHPDCSRLGEDGIDREIVGPAALLRERFGVLAIPFSYPFGWRAAAATEQVLVDRGVVDCALGIEGFAPFGTAPQALERACIEQDLTFNAFGRPLLGLPRRAARNGQPHRPARRIGTRRPHAGQSGVERSETAR